MNTGFLFGLAALALLGSWYWDSPWPVVIGAAWVALDALVLAQSAARRSAVLWALTQPARPMRMHWNFSVILTERAWDTLGVPVEKRGELQQRFGEYPPPGLTSSLFEGHPKPIWISRPVEVNYERWGESLERWTISNSWIEELGDAGTHHEKRVVDYLPSVDEAGTVVIWGGWKGPHFRFEDHRLFFVNRDEDVSTMPDGILYVKEGARVLFDIAAPILSMSRGGWWRTDEPNPLDRFASPTDPGFEGMGYYSRGQGQERFECVDWDKGFRWDLEVHDLRPALDARVSRVRRSLWRRKVTGIVVELRLTGTKLVANPLVVEPTSAGRAVPKKGEPAWIVLNDEGEIDRLWQFDRGPAEEKAP